MHFSVRSWQVVVDLEGCSVLSTAVNRNDSNDTTVIDSDRLDSSNFGGIAVRFGDDTPASINGANSVNCLDEVTWPCYGERAADFCLVSLWDNLGVSTVLSMWLFTEYGPMVPTMGWCKLLPTRRG